MSLLKDQNFVNHLRSVEKTKGLPDGLLSAVAAVESGGREGLTSPKGARGVFQFMPTTAARFGVNVDDPYSSADGAGEYLRILHDQFGDWRKAVAAYNAGEGNMAKYKEVENVPFAETRDYVEKVMGRMYGVGYKENTTPDEVRNVQNVARQIPHALTKGELEVEKAVTVPADENRSFLGTVYENDFILPNLRRSYEYSLLENDVNYVGDAKAKHLDQLAKDYSIPPHMLDTVFDEVYSAQQAQWKANRFREEVANEQYLSQYGVSGFAGRVLLDGFADPVSLGSLAVTAPLGAATGVTRLTNAVRMALLAGGENMLLESLAVQGSVHRGAFDVALAGAFGALMGGSIGAITGAVGPKTLGSTTGRKSTEMAERHISDLKAGAAGVAPAKPPQVALPNTSPTVAGAANTAAAQAVHGQVVAHTVVDMLDDAGRGTRFQGIVDAWEPPGRIAPEPPAPPPKFPVEPQAPREVVPGVIRYGTGQEVVDPYAFLRPHKPPGTVRYGSGQEVIDPYGDWDGILPHHRPLPPERPVIDVAQEGASGVAGTTKKAATGQPGTAEPRPQGDGTPTGGPIDMTRPLDEAESVGAAKVVPAVPDRSRLGAVVEDISNSIARTGVSRKVSPFDLYGFFDKSENVFHRLLGIISLENPLGRAKGQVAKESVEEIVDRRLMPIMAEWMGARKEAYKAWKKANNKFWHPVDAQREFNQLVTQAKRHGTTDENVRKAAEASDRAIQRAHKYVEDKLIGWDQFQHVANYVPRKWSRDRMRALRGIYGADVREKMLYAAMKGHLGDKLARKVSKAMSAKLDDLDNGLHYVRDVASSMKDELRHMLRDADLDEDTINNVIARVGAPDKKNGRISQALKRTLLDEDVSIKVYNRHTGKDDILTLDRFWEEDDIALTETYVRQVVGHGAWSEATKEWAEDGLWLRSQADVDKLLDDGMRYEDKLDRGHLAKREREILQNVYDRTVGRFPRHMPSPKSPMTRFVNAVMDWNFLRGMNQMFFAQWLDTAKLSHEIGMKAMLQHMPGLKHILSTAPDTPEGKTLWQHIEAFTGLGTERVRDNIHFRFGEASDAGPELVNPESIFLKNMKRVTSYPMQVTLDFQHRLVTSGLVQDIYNMALKGRVPKSPTGWKKLLTRDKAQKFRNAGLSEEMVERIFKQMTEHVETRKGLLADVVHNPNFDKWTDPEALDAMNEFLHRMSNRIIHRNFMGTIPPWISFNMLGRLAFQFRTFMLGAHAKTLVAGVRTDQFRLIANIATAGILGSMVYAGRTWLNAQGREDKDKYLRERLSPENLIKGSFQLNAYMTLVPPAVDVASSVFTGKNYFDHRSSNLSGTITGIPSVDLGMKVQGALSGAVRSALDSGYSYSKQDLDNLRFSLAYANMLGLTNFWNLVAAELPDKSTYRK